MARASRSAPSPLALCWPDHGAGLRRVFALGQDCDRAGQPRSGDRGVKQPGDEDSTRTYELAAAHCFFLHQRTDYVATVYDEQNEVPLWGDATELASFVRRWLPDEAGRRSMAARAHARAVPAYSIPQRAASVLQHIEQFIKARNASRLDA